ncbi:hypothetical protein [Chryseobacterium sp. 8AT]|uniref:hypothetical protein n=1 Tax=Chryseobacterium sp. 8AT TaxID=2653134 RepID=UPI0012F1376F|nr:hypothetical protein [Chryseobacterium sp. 8AT]VXB03274.1 conserved hypothetical protein [Chryseobacterium sp. 8AT]
MADDILDIIHRIAFDVDDANLDRLTAQLRRQTETINHLGQRQARLAQAYDRTSASEIERRRRIASLMERNNTLLQQNSRSLENNVLNNRHLNDQLTREIGLIGTINARLDILHQRRRQATSETEVRRYSQLITREQSRLDSLNRVPRNRAAGFLGNLGQLAGAGSAISSLLPAVGGALSIASLGQQIFDVTKRFEGYSQTLKNAYGSSVKAQGAFDKIQQFAAKTPYGVDELTASFIKLKNRGFDPTTEELTKMGDLAASQGKSMDQYVEALLDAQTGEYERLKEFGIKAKTTGDMVTFSFKGVEKQVKKTDQEAIRNAIISFGELKGVVGGMAGQATTLEGKLSNMGDTWDSVMYNMGKSGKGFMSDMIDLANELLSAFNDLIEKSPAQQLREEQQEVNVLMSAIASLNTENQSRNILIAELNAKYPQLVSNLDLEKRSSGDILYILKGINKAYEQRINLAQQASIKENIAKKQGKIFSDTAEDLSDPSFFAALKQTGYLDDFQKAAGNLKKQREIVAEAKKAVGKFGAFESFKNPFDGGREDTLSFSISLNSAGKALDKLIKEIPSLAKQQQIAEQGLNTVDANYKRIFNQRYDKVKREGGIAEDGSLKAEFDLVKSLGLIGSGEFKGRFDELAPDIKVPIKPTEDNKKKKKGKSPLAKAFEEIENEKKLRTELENKRKADAEERYRKDYEIDQNKFRLDLRLAKNKESSEKVLANIEIDTSKKKAVALQTKKGEPGEKAKFAANLAGENANISQSKAKLAEIANEISDGAKKEIEEAIKNFNELNDQLYSLRDQTFENELAQLDDQHNKRLEQYRKQREELTKQIVAHEEQGNLIVVGQLKSNLLKQHHLEYSDTLRYNDRIRRLKIDEFNRRVDKEAELQIRALTAWTDLKKLEFGYKVQQNEKQDKAEIQRLEKIGKEKDVLIRKQETAALYIQYNAANKKLGKLVADGKSTREEIDKQQNAVDDLARQIKDKWGERMEVPAFGKIGKAIKTLKKDFADGKMDDEQYSERLKELQAARVRGYNDMAQQATQSAQMIVSAFEQQAEREIEIRQRRVDQTREIADRGNAEALQEEERRLDKAVKTRQRFAKQQIGINLLMQASAIALAIAEAAAASGGIGAPIGIAIVLAALATGFAAVKGFQQDTPAFKDGVIGFNGKGTGTSDSNLVRISNGESVITASATQKNREILEQINAGNVFKPLEFNPGNVQPMNSTSSESYDFSRLESKIERLENAIKERTPNSISIDRRGFMAMTEEINTVNRKRSNL